MGDIMRPGRRAFGGMLAGLVTAAVLPGRRAMAAAPDGAGAVKDMIAALQSERALSFTVGLSSGASVARDKLRTLGSRASVVFQRPDQVFVVFGGGGEPDVQLLISGAEITIYRLSLASRTVLKLAPEGGAAFAVPGLFIPFLGLLADDPEAAFFGGINQVTPIPQGMPDQPEQTTLNAVLGGRFSGEVWIDRSTSLPTRTNGTWFSATGDVAASAAVEFSNWSTEAPVAGAFALKGVEAAKDVDLDALGLW